MQKKTKLIIAISLIFKAVAIYASSNQQLIFYSDLIRHGGRTTLHRLQHVKYPAVWSNNNIPKGQLTKYGLQEAIMLGKRVRLQCKSTNCQLLPSPYQPQHICVRTTGINRTIMTAEAALMGMYPDIPPSINNKAFMKLHSIPSAQDNLLLPNKPHITHLQYDPAWKNRWQKNNLGHQLYVTLYQQNPHLFPNGICNMTTSNHNYHKCLTDIIPLADNVQTLRDYCNADQTCSVTKLLGLSTIQQNNVMKAYAWIRIHGALPSATFTSSTAYRAIGEATGATLVSEIAHNMKMVIQHPTKIFPYVLYSGHDVSIFNVLGYLLSKPNIQGDADKIMTQYPGFVSDVRFLLYQNIITHQFTVKILYFDSSVDDKANQQMTVILEEPFQKFYNTYFMSEKYDSIYSKSSCDYTFGAVKHTEK